MKLIAGAGGGRPADLVLAGHVHNNWECRVAWQAAKNSFAFYSDFYTENPPVYYHTGDAELPGGRKIHVAVSEQATAIQGLRPTPAAPGGSRRRRTAIHSTCRRARRRPTCGGSGTAR